MKASITSPYGNEDMSIEHTHTLRAGAFACLLPRYSVKIYPYGIHGAFRVGSCELWIDASKSRYRAFSVAAAKVWNSLPTDLKTATCSTDTFKRRLKTWFFKRAYN